MSDKRSWLEKFLGEPEQVDALFKPVRNVIASGVVAAAGLYFIQMNRAPFLGWMLVGTSCVLVLIIVLHLAELVSQRTQSLRVKLWLIVPLTLCALNVMALFNAGIGVALR